eukprot:1634060-Amphidinium_carterae.2
MANIHTCKMTINNLIPRHAVHICSTPYTQSNTRRPKVQKRTEESHGVASLTICSCGVPYLTKEMCTN